MLGTEGLKETQLKTPQTLSDALTYLSQVEVLKVGPLLGKIRCLSGHKHIVPGGGGEVAIETCADRHIVFSEILFGKEKGLRYT